MRQQTCTTVTLRQRPIRNGRISLYLDYYPAVRNPKTMQLSRREYLAYIIHSGFISGYQNRYGDNLKPPTNVYHRMTA